MEAEDYKILLKQAEDELGSTPGAYCSRKVALRAMELLRAAGQVEFDEADKKWSEVGQQAVNNIKLYVQTIERQAEAIKRLEEEKTKGTRLGSSIGSEIDMETIARESWQKMERELYEQEMRNRNSPFRREDPYRLALNKKLDEGSPWTKI